MIGAMTNELCRFMSRQRGCGVEGSMLRAELKVSAGGCAEPTMASLVLVEGVLSFPGIH